MGSQRLRRMRLLLLFSSVFAQNQLNFTAIFEAISPLTEGSGLFDFEGTFPGLSSDVSNLTDEISSQLSSLFNDDDLEAINSFLDPIFAANLTNEQVFNTFEELLEATDPEEFLSQISENIPDLSSILAGSSTDDDADNDTDSSGLSHVFSTPLIFLITYF